MGLHLAEIFSFHVGGRVATVSGRPTISLALPQQPQPYEVDPNGEFDVGQVYVQGFRLDGPKHPVPLLLWHGGGLTGAVWETRADGRPGWLSFFLRAGFDVYVTDAVGMGRAAWAHQPELFPGEPLFRSKREAWELFRIGPPGSYDGVPERRTPFAGTQFPVDQFDQFTKRIVPRWQGMESATTEAYCALVERVGACVIVAHSSACAFAYEAARRCPALVRGLCLVEPSVPPAWPTETSLDVLAGRPLQLVFGDFFEGSPYWAGLRAQLRGWADQAGRRVPIEWLDLPRNGIPGNTHCPMADRNAEAVAGLVTDWIMRSCPSR